MADDQREEIEIEEGRSPFASPRLIAGAIALLLLAGFFLQNMQKVQINLLWFDWETRLIWALLLSAVVGAVAAWLFGSLRSRGARKREEMLAAAELHRRKS